MCVWGGGGAEETERRLRVCVCATEIEQRLRVCAVNTGVGEGMAVRELRHVFENILSSSGSRRGRRGCCL